jgi:hypothetical protein
MLAREIESLRRKGYTMAQIAESFTSDGLLVSTATLKSYMSRTKAPRRPRREPPVPSPVARKAAALTDKEAAPSTEKDPPAKSGKDAFLVKDKDSY